MICRSTASGKEKNHAQSKAGAQDEEGMLELEHIIG